MKSILLIGPNILLIGYAGLNLIFCQYWFWFLVFPALFATWKLALSNVLSPAPLLVPVNPLLWPCPVLDPWWLNLWCILWLCCCFGYLAGLWSVMNLVLVSDKWTDIIQIDPIYLLVNRWSVGPFIDVWLYFNLPLCYAGCRFWCWVTVEIVLLLVN
jgi:hypothetical protein